VPGLACFTTRLTTGATAAEGFDDDLPHARRVATHIGAELVEISIGDEVAEDLEDMVYQLDEPQADLAPLIVRRIAAAARSRGIKVLLSGTGGDDLFAGYRRHIAAAFDHWWTWLPKPVRSRLRALSDHVPVGRPTGRRVRKVLRDADLDVDARLAAYFEWLAPADRVALYTRDAVAAIAADPYRPLLESVRRLPARMHPVNRTAYLDLRYFLPDHNLNYTDKMAMAEGVEVRVPLLARNLVALAASLPVADKVRGGTGKWVLREALRPLLPAGICDRAKTGFGVPLRGWLHGPLAPLVRDVLSPANLRHHGIFDGSAVERMLAADRDGHIDAAYPLLAIVCIELWARRIGRERSETLRLNAAGA
jgi:asparagine synthase (glutamine-hydrolysing)